MRVDSMSIPHCFILSQLWFSLRFGGRRAYQSTTKEHNGDRNVLQILSTPFLSPRSQMLQENVRRPIKENEEALHKLRSYSSASLVRLDVPGPTYVRKATSPTTNS